MKTLILQVTKVQFDFDDEDFTEEERDDVVESTLNTVFEVEVSDDSDDVEIASALVEEVTDYTGWCVCNLDYIHVLNTH